MVWPNLDGLASSDGMGGTNEREAEATYSPPGAHAKYQSANRSTRRPITSGSPVACNQSRFFIRVGEARVGWTISHLVLGHVPHHIIGDQMLIEAHILWQNVQTLTTVPKIENRTDETLQEHGQHPALHQDVERAPHFMCIYSVVTKNLRHARHEKQRAYTH